MTRIICLTVCLLVCTLTAAAEERQLQAALPGETGTVALSVTLDEDNPAVLQNYSGLPPEPEPSTVPEPATLGLGVLGLIAARLRRNRQ